MRFLAFAKKINLNSEESAIKFEPQKKKQKREDLNLKESDIKSDSLTFNAIRSLSANGN